MTWSHWFRLVGRCRCRGARTRGRPGVHHGAEPAEWTIWVEDRAIGVITAGGGAFVGWFGAVDVDGAAQLLLCGVDTGSSEFPEFFDGGGELGEAFGVVGRRSLEDGGTPFLEGFRLFFAELFGLSSAGHRSPAMTGQEEMVNFVGGERRVEGSVGRWHDLGRVGFLPRLLRNLVDGPGGPATADEAVALAQLEAEPGRLETGYIVEPETDFGEFDGGRVEVDAVRLVGAKVGLDFLELNPSAFGIERLAKLG